MYHFGIFLPDYEAKKKHLNGGKKYLKYVAHENM